MGFWEVFSSLPRPAQEGAYTVESREAEYRVARSTEDFPALIIEFKHRASSAPRRLANLAYIPPSSVEVIAADGSVANAHLAVLECRSIDPELSRYFFRITRAILIENEGAANETGFEHALDTLVRLFRALRRTATRSLQGLWAELAIIYWSKNPHLAISSWHSAPTALHDFASGACRFEVKSTQRPVREHHFRLNQLLVSQTGNTLVASLLLKEGHNGESVRGLSDLIAGRLKGSSESAARLEAIIVESLGADWKASEDVRFLLDEALGTLRIYNAIDIPSVPEPLPAEVKDVHFVADLSGLHPMTLTSVRNLAPLYAQLLPEMDSY